MLRILPLIVLFTFLSVGCATTGDPTTGGLLGWSKKKADLRVTQLEHDSNSANSAVDSEQNESERLSRTLAAAEVDLAEQWQQLNNLVKENQRLHAKLESLKQSEKTTGAQLTQLEIEREALIRRISEVDRNTFVDTHFFSNQMNELNERYKDAILILLQP